MRLHLPSISVLFFIIGQRWATILLANCNGLTILVPPREDTQLADGQGGSNIGTGYRGASSRHVVERLYIFDRNQLDDISNDLRAQLNTLASSWDQTLDDTNIGTYEQDDNVGDLIGDDELPKLSFFDRAKDYVRRSIAPAREYYSLIRRFRAWYRDYNALIESIHDHHKENADTYESENKQLPSIRSAMDAIQIEYAKVDQKLYEEAVSCRRTRRLKRQRTLLKNKIDANNNNDEGEAEIEPDFLLRALKLLIQRLEQNLSTIKSKGFMNENEELDELLLKMNSEDQDEYTRMAIDRAKNIAKRKAKRVALREIRHLFKFVLLNSLANQVKNRDRSLEGPDDALNYLEPIVLLLGDVDTPVIVTYLCDLRFRLALSLVNHLRSIRVCPP